METVRVPGKSVDSSGKRGQLVAVLRRGEYCERDRDGQMLVPIGREVGQPVLEQFTQDGRGVLPAVGALLGGDLAG